MAPNDDRHRTDDSRDDADDGGTDSVTDDADRSGTDDADRSGTDDADRSGTDDADRSDHPEADTEGGLPFRDPFADDTGVGRRRVLAAAGTGLSAAALAGVPGGDGAAQETPNATATPTEEGTPTDQPEGTPGPAADASFAETPVRQQRGDVAEFTVQLENTDRATLVVGSEDVNYVARVTLVDADGDGEVTVLFDTLRAGQGDQSGFDVAGEDRLENYVLVTEPLADPGERFDPLEAGLYGLQVRIDDLAVAGGGLLLTEGSLEGIDLLVAPMGVADAEAAIEAATPAEGVAENDWAILRVQASGIYALLDDLDDLNTDQTGFVFRVEERAAVNRPARELSIEDATLVVEPENDRFFVVLPRDAVTADNEYETVFAIVGTNPYVPDDERREVSTTFRAVERSATIDGPRPLRLPAAEAELSGTATVAPGTPITVGVEGAGVGDVARTTVDGDGTWSVTLDLSSAEPGTRVTTRVLDLSGPVRGIVVAADGGADTETPTDGEVGTETPEGETGTETPTEGTSTPTGGTETPGAGG